MIMSQCIYQFSWVCIFIIALNGCSVDSSAEDLTDYSRDRDSFSQSDIELIQTKTGVDFPEESIGLNMLYDKKSVDSILIAKLSVANESSKSLLDQLEAMKDGHRLSSGKTEGLEWWNPPGEAEAFRQDQVLDGVYTMTNVLVSSEDEGLTVFVISVEAHELSEP